MTYPLLSPALLPVSASAAGNVSGFFPEAHHHFSPVTLGLADALLYVAGAGLFFGLLAALFLLVCRRRRNISPAVAAMNWVDRCACYRHKSVLLFLLFALLCLVAFFFESGAALFGLASDAGLGLMDGAGLIVLVAVALVFAAGLWQAFLSVHASPRRRLLGAAVAVWAAGYVLYFVGFYSEGTRYAPAAFIIRPALSSLELFVSHSDLIEVAENCKASPLYMSLFALVSLLALGVSAAAVIGVAGRRFRFWVKFRALTAAGRELYLFWGVSDASLALAASVRAKVPDAVLLFVDSRSEAAEEEEHGRLSFGHILNMFSYRCRGLERLDDLDAHFCLCEESPRGFSSLSAADREQLMRRLGLRQVDRLVAQARQVHAFFMTDADEENIRRGVDMVHFLDGHISPSAGEADRFTVYCRACHDSVNNVAELVSNRPGLHLCLIDSACLAVEGLKVRPEHHPVRFVRVEPDASVSDPFHALVVGFGPAGRAALDFLYEFSALADNAGRRSPFRIDAFDHRMGSLGPDYLTQRPALAAPGVPVGLHGADARSAEFAAWLRDHIARLNYVVITLGPDPHAIDLAVSIFEQACRYRPDGAPRLGIYLRVPELRLEQDWERVADFYNARSGRTDIRLVLFGLQEQIYSYDIVVHGAVERAARRFYNKYEELRYRSEPPASAVPPVSWDDRRRKAHDAGTLAALAGLRRKEGQDRANALHAHTKLHLLRAALPRLTAADLCAELSDARITGRGMDYPHASGPTAAVMLRMAQCEHLRWMAAHELLGYLPADGATDDLRRLHSCLVPWDDLDALSVRSGYDYKSYDFNVVDTTVGLAAEDAFSVPAAAL